MRREPLEKSLDHLKRLVPPSERDDAELLSDFAARRDELAIAELIRRHGRMVLGVCRRVLGDVHAADDAFQAVFMVLVKQAGKLRRPDRLGPWLYGVACRVAWSARRRGARRPTTVRSPALDLPAPGESAVDGIDDFRPILDEEVSRLPERYRAAVLACYLEGRPYDEAARRLGWPKGTLATRLAKARELLRSQLERRGVTLSLAAISAALESSGLSLVVPPALADSTLRASLAFAAGHATPRAATLLARGAMQTMTAKKILLGVCVGLFLAIALSGGYVAYVAFATDVAGPRSPANEFVPPGIHADLHLDRLGDPLPTGARTRFGSLRFRHPEAANVESFSDDGKLLYALDSNFDPSTTEQPNNVVRVWNVETGEQARVVALESRVFAIRSNLLATWTPRRSVIEVRRLDIDEAVASIPLADGTALSGLAVSRDGARLAAVDDQHAVHVFEIPGGKNVATIAAREGVTCQWVKFADKSSTLVLDKGGHVEIRDLDAGTIVSTIAPAAEIWWPTLSDDGKTLAATDTRCPWPASPAQAIAKSRLACWNLDKSEPFYLGSAVSAHRGFPSPDGSLLASASYLDGDVAVWNLKSRAKLPPLQAVAPMRTDQGVFGDRTSTTLRRFSSCYVAKYSMAFSPDGSTLATGGQPVRLWDVATGKSKPVFGPHQAAITALAVSADGRRLVSGDVNHSLVVWNAHDGERVISDLEVVSTARTGLESFLRRDVGFGTTAAALSRDGKRLAAAFSDDTIRLWHLDSDTLPRFLQTVSGSFVDLQFSDDGASLLGCRSVDPNSRKPFVVSWNLESGKASPVDFDPERPTPGHQYTSSPIGSHVAIPNGIHGFRLLDLANTRSDRLVDAGPPTDDDAYWNSFAITRDARYAAFGSSKGQVKLVTAVGNRERECALPKLTGFACLAFSPDGRHLASADESGTIRLLEVASGKVRREFTGHLGPVTRLVFSPDAKTLFSSSADTTVLAWNLAR